MPNSVENGSTWAGNAAYWIKIIREGLDPFRLELTNNAVLEAVAPRAGMNLLDAGCGEGYLGRLLAQGGAQVTGIDACAPLLDAAREAAQQAGIEARYDEGSLNELPYATDTFDVVVTHHVLNELSDMPGAVRELARVLRPGGRLVSMMLHPCFYRANFARGDHMEPVESVDYFSVREINQDFLVSGLQSPEKVRLWLHPLENYVGAYTNAGLTLTRLSEPHPPAEVMQTEWWQKNFRMPLFLMLVGTKLQSP